MSIVTKKLIKQYKGKIVSFRYLPLEWQLSTIQFMAVDKETWELPDNFPGIVNGTSKSDVPYYKSLKKISAWMKLNISFWIEYYGDTRFGMLYVPMNVFCKAVDSTNRDSEWYDTFEKYHDWYISNYKKIYKTQWNENWPSILDTNPDCEILQDGWHRFHTYVERGVKTMPLLYFP